MLLELLIISVIRVVGFGVMKIVRVIVVTRIVAYGDNDVGFAVIRVVIIYANVSVILVIV